MEAEVVEEARGHQHGHVSSSQGHQGSGAEVGCRPEGVGDVRAGPQSGASCLCGGRQGIDGARCEQDVPGGRSGSLEDRVAVGSHWLQFSLGPRPDLLLCVGVEARLGLAAAHEDHLVEGLPLGIGECPAPHGGVVGREVSCGDREASAGNDEDQEAVLCEVSGAVREERVFCALLFSVVVVGRVEVCESEGLVCDGGLEQVCGQGAVEPSLRLLCALAVQFHAVGLDGNGVGPAQELGQLRRGLSGSAAWVQDAERLAAAAAGRRIDHLRDHVHHAVWRGVEPSLCLRCKSHVSPPSPWMSFVVDRPKPQGLDLRELRSVPLLAKSTYCSTVRAVNTTLPLQDAHR